ncbi:MAG: DUF5654 family protein [Ktedonobacterales bacterium]
MNDYPQANYPPTSDVQVDEHQRRRMSLPAGADPRRMMDSAAVEKMLHAQAVARAEAQAASTVVIATIVSLVTSAFSFVAALAWNTAIQQILQDNVNGPFKSYHLPQGTIDLIYAVIVTVIAVAAVVIINRFARDIAKKSAIGAASK